jgi:hypothetical protein
MARRRRRRSNKVKVYRSGVLINGLFITKGKRKRRKKK